MTRAAAVHVDRRSGVGGDGPSRARIAGRVVLVAVDELVEPSSISRSRVGSRSTASGCSAR